MAHTESAEKAATAERQDSGSSSTSHSRDKETADRIITYVYRPPKGKGKTQRVCGILGKDKRETIAMVKRGLPDLSGVDEERFDFEVYNARDGWIKVMEEAWKSIRLDTPDLWTIIIQELPEERQQRLKSQKMWDLRGWKAQLINISIFAIAYAIANKAGMLDGTFWRYAKVSGMACLLQAVVHIIIGGISAM